MTLDELELMERTTFEMVVRAISDYFTESVTVFREERDQPGYIAEDVMREAVEAMGISGIRERLYGKVDYKKAIYVFLSHAQPVALMLDAKAEKGNASATIQMSQTSMRVRYVDSRGNTLDEQGKLAATIIRGERELKVVTIVAKYVYADRPHKGHDLKKIVVVCIPNAAFQERYNPNPESTIWRAGRHAPTRGQEFRVRPSFRMLQAIANWRVGYIEPNWYN